MPRAPKPTGKTRHDPLHVQLKEDELVEKYGNVSHPGKRKKSRKSKTDDDEAGAEVSLLQLHTVYIDVLTPFYAVYSRLS